MGEPERLILVCLLFPRLLNLRIQPAGTLSVLNEGTIGLLVRVLFVGALDHHLRHFHESLLGAVLSSSSPRTRN